MRDLENLNFFPTSTRLVDILCQKTRSNNRLFFHILVGYYLTKVASMMRINIDTHDRGVIPINMYAVNLALSGQGKGHSTNIIEEHLIQRFKNRFLKQTFEHAADKNVRKLAQSRSATKNCPFDEELTRCQKEFEDLGPLAFSFDSGTGPAVKQMRHKLLMANAGSMNLEIDEIGSNLMQNTEVLNMFLELYDVGKIKQKLIKNTSDNSRNADIEGKTPTNMMLFGTPTKLLSGDKTETEFMSMLETGYARRCFFGYSRTPSRDLNMTPEEIYDMMTDTTSDNYLDDLANDLCDLACETLFNKSLTITKDTTLHLIEYQTACEKQAEMLPEHMEIAKAELKHRYFKALKLAGAYAFIDNSNEVTEDHLYYGIKMAEESGKAFNRLLNRDRNYAKLALYIAEMPTEVTQVDLYEDLQFYRGSQQARKDMMDMAIAYGYKNNIIIKRSLVDNIEFLSGETLEKTNLDKMMVSYSKEYTEGYRYQEAPFTELHRMTQVNGLHWVSHELSDGYRSEEKVKPGFNMVVLDIDGTATLETAKLLLKDFTYLMYTTKSHSAKEHRFRILLPMSHVLRLTREEYTDFMKNLAEWLPIEVDTQTFQRSRKWESFDGDYWYNDGDYLNALLFISKTTKGEETKQIIRDLASLNNVERWFIKNIESGNRNSQLIKYALMLVDSGMDMEDIRNRVMSLNSKLKDGLDEAEIMSTIMVTVSKAIHTRDKS